MIGRGVDYASALYNVTIPAEDTNLYFTVVIHDDSILEQNESFNFTINAFSLPHYITVTDPVQATVTIVDDDGK